MEPKIVSDGGSPDWGAPGLAVFARPGKSGIQSSEVNSGFVIERYASIPGVLVEDPVQFFQHWRVLRMLRSGRVRRRQQPPLNSRIVEFLPHGKDTLLERRGIEKFIHGIRGVLVPDLFVIGANFSSRAS